MRAETNTLDPEHNPENLKCPEGWRFLRESEVKDRPTQDLIFAFYTRPYDPYQGYWEGGCIGVRCSISRGLSGRLSSRLSYIVPEYWPVGFSDEYAAEQNRLHRAGELPLPNPNYDLSTTDKYAEYAELLALRAEAEKVSRLVNEALQQLSVACDALREAQDAHNWQTQEETER